MILQREASDPRFLTVTISSVSVAKDLSTARIFFSSYDPQSDEESLTDSLNHAAGFFSQKLARTLKTRIVPRLHFTYDKGFDYAVEVDRLINRALSSEDE